MDKKGILSWANPSAEKVFLFSSATKDCMKLTTKDSEGNESGTRIHERRKKPKRLASKYNNVSSWTDNKARVRVGSVDIIVYWHTDTVSCRHGQVNHFQAQLVLGLVTILVCQFLLMVLWMRL